MKTIKIYLVDDHKMIRIGIHKILEKHPNITVIGEGENGLDCLEDLKTLQPDIVLTDINMPKMDGITLTKELLSNNPNLKVIGLTMMDDTRHVKQLLAEGASGYLLKDCEEEEIISAINIVSKGGSYYSYQVTSIIMDNLRKIKPRKDKMATKEKISDREKQVLHLILKEYSNKEIAEELFISINTVDAHKRNLLDKTGSKNLAGLILYAIDAQLFDDI